MRNTSLSDRFPLPHFLDSLRQKHIATRVERLNTMFASCKLSYDHFKKGTGLVFLHLNRTKNTLPKVQLFDPIGAVHTLDLDRITFALQKKASLAYPTLAALMEIGEIEAAKIRLSSLLDLIEERSLSGIADHDPRKRNFGFVGEQAIEIDLGSFSQKPSLKIPENRKKVLIYETLKLRRYIKKYHPELSDFLEESLKERLKSNSDIT